MANATKPLMIRGDRLLLALDVMACWARYPENEQPHHDTTRVDTILGNFFTGANAQNCFEDAFERSLYQICGFLASLGVHEMPLQLMDFPLSGVEAFLNEYVLPRDATEDCMRFLSAIASGELTEADFRKEPSA